MPKKSISWEYCDNGRPSLAVVRFTSFELGYQIVLIANPGHNLEIKVTVVVNGLVAGCIEYFGNKK